MVQGNGGNPAVMLFYSAIASLATSTLNRLVFLGLSVLELSSMYVTDRQTSDKSIA